MDHSCEVSVFKLELFDDLTCLSVEDEKFAILSQGEDQVRGDYKVQDGLGVTFVYGVSMHLIPCNYFICLFKACVNETSRGGLQICNLFCNEAGHED